VNSPVRGARSPAPNTRAHMDSNHQDFDEQLQTVMADFATLQVTAHPHYKKFKEN